MSRSTALLLVDAQEDYLARPGLEPQRDLLVNRLATALAEARRAGTPVIHVRTDGSEPMPHRQAAPEAVGPGALPPLGLAEHLGERVFTKRFFSAFDADGLAEHLAAEGIASIRLAGVHTHACIQATALDAYARGIAVEIDPELVGSDRPVHAAETLAWLDGRAATIIGRAAGPWRHYAPYRPGDLLFEVPVSDDVDALADNLAKRPREPVVERRAALLQAWHAALEADRSGWVEALIEDVGKPRRDAEAEVGYGLALLAHTARTLVDREQGQPGIRYQPIGLTGLITPWNNPFAIPVGKLAPAMGYGNAALWKPAPAGTRIAERLKRGLDECGLGEWVELVTGGADAARAVARHPALGALSFTGSVPAGRQLIAAAGRRTLPVQAELGGSNAAIVHASADLEAAAADLAPAIYSFAGQRCTAIRRIIVDRAIADRFVELLVPAIEALAVGDPADPATQVGPVIDARALAAFEAVAASGGQVLTGGASTDNVMQPTLLTDLPLSHALLTREVFGPLAAIQLADGIDEAIALHNASEFGLVGALYATDPAAEAAFTVRAEAGMLSLNRARPPFSPAGPFAGWKASAFGLPEHGRWARDFFSRVQAIYR